MQHCKREKCKPMQLYRSQANAESFELTHRRNRQARMLHLSALSQLQLGTCTRMGGRLRPSRTLRYLLTSKPVTQQNPA